MSASQWSTSELSGFAEAAESLKLYRRAELYTDTGDRPIIEDLYVDPLPDKQILRTLLRAHTTFVIGRKGTGKSTIFQRAQHEIRKQKNAVSAYIDIKTVYESSQVDLLFFHQCQVSVRHMPVILVYDSCCFTKHSRSKPCPNCEPS
jgi:hypothetical protein